jgi:hypothetical protein
VSTVRGISNDTRNDDRPSWQLPRVPARSPPRRIVIQHASGDARCSTAWLTGISYDAHNEKPRGLGRGILLAGGRGGERRSSSASARGASRPRARLPARRFPRPSAATGLGNCPPPPVCLPSGVTDLSDSPRDSWHPWELHGLSVDSRRSFSRPLAPRAIFRSLSIAPDDRPALLKSFPPDRARKTSISCLPPPSPPPVPPAVRPAKDEASPSG